MTATNSTADELQKQMRAVRSEMGEDVQEIVANARVLSHWQYYVRTYPWVCVGAAAAIGYLLVPQKMHIVRPDAQALAELAKQHRLVVDTQAKPKSSVDPLGRLMNVAAGFAMQSAMALASRQVQQVLQGLAEGGDKASGARNHEEPHR